MLNHYRAHHQWLDDRRYYQIPSGELFPGVTTILSATKSEADCAALDRWRSRVGTAVADQLSQQATRRGTYLHEALESHLRGVPSKIHETAIDYWPGAIEILNRTTCPLLIEGAVWHPLGYAGTADCIAILDGQLQLIDWKTSKKFQKWLWITDYRLQVAAYWQAVEHVYGLTLPRAAIVIFLPNAQAQVFTLDRPTLQAHFELFKVRIDAYYQNVLKEKPQITCNLLGRSSLGDQVRCKSQSSS